MPRRVARLARPARCRSSLTRKSLPTVKPFGRGDDRGQRRIVGARAQTGEARVHLGDDGVAPCALADRRCDIADLLAHAIEAFRHAKLHDFEANPLQEFDRRSGRVDAREHEIGMIGGDFFGESTVRRNPVGGLSHVALRPSWESQVTKAIRSRSARRSGNSSVRILIETICARLRPGLRRRPCRTGPRIAAPATARPPRGGPSRPARTKCCAAVS